MRAGLEGRIVARGSRVEGVNGTQDGISILACTTVVFVDVGRHVCAVPEALEKTQDLRRNAGARGTSLTQSGGERGAFDQGSMLHRYGEE